MKTRHYRIYGRLWFNKRTGNTYHTATVSYLDDSKREVVLYKSDITYGYEDHFKQTVSSLFFNVPVLREFHSKDFFKAVVLQNVEFIKMNVKRKKDL